MGLLSFLFGSKKDVPVQDEVSSKILPEIKEEDFVDNSDPNEDLYTVHYGTKMPIDAIYAYINRDYEQSGYDDAMVNADSTYKDSKKNIIKNELRRLFEQVTLRYRNDLRDIEVQIEIVEQQGLINTASSLKARKDTYIEHMSVMKDMVESLEKEEPQMMSMVKSYERGFLKGLAAKSDLLLRNNHGNN